MVRRCSECGADVPEGRETCGRCETAALSGEPGTAGVDAAPISTPDSGGASQDEVETLAEETEATARSGRSERAPAPATLAGRYRLIQRLGAGGGGEVHRAYDSELDREVALKLLSTEASEKSITRFRREVGVAQELNHPGLVRVYDIGREKDRYYLSMQLVHGQSLSARLHEAGPLPVAEARKLFLEVCDAVRYLHSAGIVHRDIKPANVLLDSETGHALLADFGLARQAVDRDGDDTEIAGTPGYMAPEVMLGEPPSVSTDIYGLGATFYAVLTGKKAHEGSAWSEILLKKREEAPTLRRLRPEVPPELAFVVEECLHPDPRRRFASVDEVIEALELSGAPRWKRLWIRTRRRRRVPALVLAAVAVLALIGTGVWAASEAGRAVEVTVEGERLVGLNRFGGAAWQRSYDAESVGVETWPDTCGAPVLYHVIETNNSPGSRLHRHNHLLTQRGAEVFDSAPLDTRGLGFFDPRREFSGTVSFDVVRWSRCQGPSDTAALPLFASNDPWYFSVFGLHDPDRGSSVSFAFSGRVISVAASQVPGQPLRYGIVAGNHELLHTSALAILPASGLAGANPPRMVDQTFENNNLYSYTLLPADHKTYGVDALIAEPDGSWRVCTADDRCEAIDRFGNRAAALREHPDTDAEMLLHERMERFRRLSEIDLSRRRGAYPAADEGYRELAAIPAGDSIEQAALHFVGARIAAALGDLDAVVARSRASQDLWQTTEDAALVRAEARIIAGRHGDALRDLHAAQGQRSATIYNVTKWRFFSAWLSGDHVLARRLVDDIDFPVLQARLRAFVLIADGEPAQALELLDPWVEHFVRDRVQLLRALALVDLNRTDEARQALEAEVERHPWLRDEADGISLAADLVDGRDIAPERAEAILAEAERRGRREMESRLLLARVRLEVAEAFARAGETERAREVLGDLDADHPGITVLARARQLLESLEARPAAGTSSGERGG